MTKHKSYSKTHPPPPHGPDDPPESLLPESLPEHRNALSLPDSPAPIELPTLEDGKVRVRVRSLHGNVRGVDLGGQHGVLWFSPTETDHTVTPEELATLRNDPILSVHDLSNGFSQEHVAKADHDVELAHQLLSEALAIQARVHARSPARNQVHTPALFEGGEAAKFGPSAHMIRPEDVLVPEETLRDARGREVPRSVGYVSGLGPDESVQANVAPVTGKPMPGDAVAVTGRGKE